FSAMTAPTQHSLKITKESLKKVTVFNDRAELRREFTVELAAGVNEVTIGAISTQAIDDSIQVTGRGAAVIEEVQISKKFVAKGENDSERAAELRKEKEELEVEREKVNSEGEIVFNQSEALDRMVKQIGKNADGKCADKLSTASLDSITSFFGFHRKEAAKLKEEFRSLRKEFSRLTERIALKEQELAAISKGDFNKNIVVLLEAAEDATSVVLEVTYQVTRTGWSPLYDIRVDTKDDKTEMQLSYYANVHQSTGEDWEGAQLMLSTARPCLGGTIPELGTLSVSLYRPPPKGFSFGTGPTCPATVPPTRGLFGSAVGSAPTASTSVSLFGARSSPAAPIEPVIQPAMEARQAAVSEQMLSTEFSIARPCSIPADGAMHKATIGIITLSPRLVHESVPSKNPSAFLTASALNSSQLPILAGCASVYLDGAYVAKTGLKSVSPGERFTTSLGVDAGVRIKYTPARKFHEQTGIISKWSSTMTEQDIVFKNTRGDGIFLVIREQIPRSTDEKIQVKVLSPEIKDNEEKDSEENHKVGARILPSSNNLEWKVKLEKGESRTFLVKYSIEHPKEEKLDFRCI
ncbi:hypothetical protein PMAYCL1PPCAC_32839, partial [Pristionchus mayeri]